MKKVERRVFILKGEENEPMQLNFPWPLVEQKAPKKICKMDSALQETGI